MKIKRQTASKNHSTVSFGNIYNEIHKKRQYDTIIYLSNKQVITNSQTKGITKTFSFFLIENQSIKMFCIFFLSIYVFDIQNSCIFAVRYPKGDSKLNLTY